MRYPFRTVDGTPALQPVNIGITLVAAPLPSAVVPPAVLVADLAVVSSVTDVSVAPGESASFSLLVSNNGQTAISDAVLHAPWLLDNADRTFAAIVVNAMGGADASGLTNATAAAGFALPSLPPAGSVTIAVVVNAIQLFFQAFVTTIAAPTPWLEATPLDNTVVLAMAATSVPPAAWRNWTTAAPESGAAQLKLKDKEWFNTVGSYFMFAQGGDARIKTFSGFGDVVGADCAALTGAFDLYDSAATLEVVIGSFDGGATYGAVMSGGLADFGLGGAWVPGLAVTQIVDGLRVELDFREHRAAAATTSGAIGTLTFSITKNSVAFATLSVDCAIC